MDFQIRGASYAIEPEDIMSATRRVQPNATDGRNKYFVALHGQQYPIKQVIQLVTGLASPVFTAQYAYRILSRLGFEISERADATVYARPPRAPTRDWTAANLPRRQLWSSRRTTTPSKY